MNLPTDYVRRKIIPPLTEALAHAILSHRDQRQVASEVFDRPDLIEFEGNATNVWYNILTHASTLEMMDALLNHSLVRYYLERNPDLIYCELLWLVSHTEWDLERLAQNYKVNILASSVEEPSIPKFKDIADILAHIWRFHGKASTMQFASYLIGEIKVQNVELLQKLQNWMSIAQVKLKTETNLANKVKTNRQQIDDFIPSQVLQSIDQPQEQMAAIKEKLSNQQDYEQKIDDWLKQFGFDHNPFIYSNSEYNARLSEYFVEHVDFNNTVGFNNRFIFARPGDGKTAIRLRLQAHYRDTLRDHCTFAFSYLIPKEIAAAPPPTMSGHYKWLLTAAVRHVFVLFILRGLEPPLGTATSLNLIAPQLVIFFNEYYPTDHNWQRDLQEVIESRSLHQIFQNLSPVYDNLESVATMEAVNTQWLRSWLKTLATAASNALPSLPQDSRERWLEFCDLMSEVGIQHIIILVDGVNLIPTHEYSPEVGSYDHVEHMQSIVKPILGTLNKPLWDERVYWKFFLPLELYLPLMDPEELDHRNCVLIEWDSNRLKALLQSRLSTASNLAITSLNQLAAKDVKFNLDAYFCIASGASPRYLIHNINKMLSFHVNSAGFEQGMPRKISHASLSKMR